MYRERIQEDVHVLRLKMERRSDYFALSIAVELYSKLGKGEASGSENEREIQAVVVIDYAPGFRGLRSLLPSIVVEPSNKN